MEKTLAEIRREQNRMGGRPKGSRNRETYVKEAMLEIFKKRTGRAMERLFNAQLSIATGIQILYKIEKEFVKTGKGGFWRAKKPVIVEDPAEIADYLEGRIRQGEEAEESADPAATYYYITTKEPNNFAIDSMIDRTFGKSRQPVTPVDEKGRLITFLVPAAIAEKHGIKNGATSDAEQGGGR